MNTENIGYIVVLAVAVVIAWCLLRARYLHEFVVNDGLIGLIYRNGKLTEALNAGRYFRWAKSTASRLSMRVTRCSRSQVRKS